MLLYYHFLQLTKGKACFDRWVDDHLVHYNYYEKSIELKDKNFNIIETMPLHLFKFRPSDRAKYYLRRVS